MQLHSQIINIPFSPGQNIKYERSILFHNQRQRFIDVYSDAEEK